jgi:uncharacterized membrane protein YphA (DoxX/SURF4 family)
MRFPLLEFVTAVRIAAALIFFTAAAAKMRRWRTFEGVVANYRLLPDPLVPLAAWVLPPGEILLAVALVFGLPGSELAASALLCLFAAAMAINLARGRTHIDCGCFDAAQRQPLRWSLVVRNLVLVSLLIAAARSRDAAAGWDFATMLMGVLCGSAFFIVVQCANILTALPAKRRTT